MVQIILNDDQSKRLLSASGDAVELVDSRGKVVGHLQRPAFSESEIAEAVHRANTGGPWYSTEEVLEHLSKLEK